MSGMIIVLYPITSEILNHRKQIYSIGDGTINLVFIFHFMYILLIK